MHKREITFIVAFVLSLAILSYLFGNSITGYFVQSLHCDHGECKEFCRFSYDCKSEDEVCCARGNYGVCELSSACEQEYQLEPQSALDRDEVLLSNPSPPKNNSLIFSLLIVLLIILGVMYLMDRTHYK